MTDLGTEEPLSSLSESSFVILGQGSLPLLSNDDSCKDPILNPVTNSNGSFSGLESSDTNINNSQILSRSIFSEEGIQKKLNELVKENYQLKETLSQNNLAIKSQLDTFFMWQQEVLKTHETHKQKFLETKDLILKLRAENTSLKKLLEDSLVCVPPESDFEIYAEVNKKPEELDKLKEKLKEFESMYNNLTRENENLSMTILKQTEELKSANNEILKLNSELEDLGRDNTYLKQGNEESRKNSPENTSQRSLPNSEARTQISNLLKQLDEEKSKVLKLREELKKIKLSDGKAAGSKLSTTEELNQYIDNLNDMDLSLDMQNQRFSTLQSWVSLAEESLKENKIHTGVECNLLCEINELKSHLNQEESVSRKKQETLQELKQKFTVLLDDYKALQLKLTLINNNGTDIEKYKEEISSLSAKLEDKDNELKLKEQEWSDLIKEIENLKLNSEEIQLLKFQVQVYQSDFQDERAAREKLVDEKNYLEEEVRRLQNKINQLEQLNPSRNDYSESSPLESPGRPQRFMCPKCSLTFPDQNECLRHYADCCNCHFCP